MPEGEYAHGVTYKNAPAARMRDGLWHYLVLVRREELVAQ